jgi:hypothetical protein
VDDAFLVGRLQSIGNLGIPSEIDYAHPTGTEFFQDFVVRQGPAYHG